MKSNNDILVSISCMTYNHASYIRQCLDGFLMQKTNFKFEVLIHDDASTDGTEEIIREYEAKYPNIIKALYEEENQWSKGRRGNKTFNYPRAKGKYIAMCEGDDYWIDPYKLQKQVDILEANKDCIICATGFAKDDGVKREISLLTNKSKKFTLMDFTKKWYCKTLTVLFRTAGLSEYLKQVGKYKYSRDTHLYYHLLRQGNGYYLAEISGVYNLHRGGICSMVSKEENAIIAYKIATELYYYNNDKYTEKRLFLSILSILHTNAFNSKQERGFFLRKAINYSRSLVDVIKVFRCFIVKLF